MATYNWDSTQIVSSIANYNAMYLPVQTFMASFGWTQTSDTGQINFVGNAAFAEDPATQYQMWLDNSQPGFPLYLKIEFSRITSNTAKVWLTLGTATDGAGNLIGNKTNRFAIQSNAAATLHTHYASGEPGRVWVSWMGVTSPPGVGSGGSMFFLVERSKNSLGADTDDFATIMGSSGGLTATLFQSLHKTFGATTALKTTPTPMRGETESSVNSFGGYGGVFAVFPLLGRNENPLMDLSVAQRIEHTDNSNISIFSYGANRTYKVMGNASSSSANLRLVGSGAAIMIRYE